MTDRAVSVAALQTLDASLSVDVAREADALGYSSVWVAEANGVEGLSLLGAISQATTQAGLGTGVLALQLRTPPLQAMAAATLQQLAGDRDVYFGIGISSPAVAGQWHGAGYGDRPIAQTREFVTLLRECLSGERVTFEGDFYTVKRFKLGVRLGERRPKIVMAALNKQMLRLAGELSDAVLLNYLPATAVPWCVSQIREGGAARIFAYIHCTVTDRDCYADLARRDLLNYTVVPAYAAQFDRGGFFDEVRHFQHLWSKGNREGALKAISDEMVDAIEIMGDESHVEAAVQAYADAGVEVPIVFPAPWGEDRRETLSRTLRALA